MTGTVPLPAANADEPVTSEGIGRLGGFIGFRLRRIQNHLSRSFGEAAASYRLRSGALSALAIIEDNPGVSQAAIARQIGMDTSAAVALLDELEQRGWITRRRVAHDRRRYAIFLLPLGRAMLDELFAILEGTEEAVLKALSPAELLLLNRTLDRIYDRCFAEPAGS